MVTNLWSDMNNRSNLFCRASRVLLLPVLWLLACEGGWDLSGPAGDGGAAQDGGAAWDRGAEPAELPCGQHCREYVLDRLLMPTSEADGMRYGLRFQGQIYNALGNLLALLALGGNSMQAIMDDGVNQGTLLLMLRLVARDIVDEPDARAQLFLGDHTRCCSQEDADACAKEARSKCFAGDGVFKKAKDSPKNMIFSGAIAKEQMEVGPSTMSLAISFRDGKRFTIAFKHAFISGRVNSAQIMEGAIAGAVPQTELQGKLLPEVAQLVDSFYKDPTGDPKMKAIMKSFDTDGDGSITMGELLTNPLLQGLFTGDVDVDGDGHNELSLGIGFTAVPCTIADVESW